MTEELVDVVSAAGEPSGITKTKAAVHRDGDWHRAAHLWVVTPSREVVLQRRALTKENHPGLWDVSAAGHLSAGESAIDAVVREAAEELGLDVAVDELRPLGTCREQVVLNGGRYIDNEIHDVFIIVRKIDNDAIRFGRDEVMDVALIGAGELRERVAAQDPSLVPHACEYELLFEYLSARSAKH